MRLRRSSDRANSNQTRDLQSFGHVVKHCWNSIKIGRHSPFGPLTHVDFVQFFQKSMGWHFAQALPELHGINVSQLSLHTSQVSLLVLVDFIVKSQKKIVIGVSDPTWMVRRVSSTTNGTRSFGECGWRAVTTTGSTAICSSTRASETWPCV